MNTDSYGYETGVVAREVALLIAVACALFVVSGCAYHLHPYNAPSDQTLKVLHPMPERFSVRVENLIEDKHAVVPVGTNGIVNFHVPSLPRGCAVYLFEVVKISDSRPEDVRAINLQKDGKTVRKLSLNDIAKLGTDTNGVRQIKVK